MQTTSSLIHKRVHQEVKLFLEYAKSVLETNGIDCEKFPSNPGATVIDQFVSKILPAFTDTTHPDYDEKDLAALIDGSLPDIAIREYIDYDSLIPGDFKQYSDLIV
jgi:hypothetical protein